MAPPPHTARDVTVVVPTIGRPSLGDLLGDLAASRGPLPSAVVLADDRPDPSPPLLDEVAVPDRLRGRVTVVHTRGRGPAAARNAGWRRARTAWIAFVDDDVRPPPDWTARLDDDLRACAPSDGGSQGRIVVPLPPERPPTDWERNVAGLEQARWATADMAYRREALEAAGGFDEQFRRAYREDADLALRVADAGWGLVQGQRVMVHPVRPAEPGISVRMQAGNFEDPYMRLKHGAGWRDRAGVPAGRRRSHLAVAAATGLAGAALATGRPRWGAGGFAVAAGLVSRFAWERISPGPRDATEVGRMVATSTVLPFAATWHWLRGVAAAPVRRRRPSRPPAAVLFDRDGTLVRDVPYNGDPDRVEPMPGARRAIRRLRRHGVAVGVVTNQSGIARGLLTGEEARAVNARLDALVGPVDTWVMCPHGPDDGCPCRKPAPGMIVEAARRLGVAPEDCVVIGDTGADVAAARAAGAHGILVPTPVTRRQEVEEAPDVAADLTAAVDRALAHRGVAA